MEVLHNSGVPFKIAISRVHKELKIVLGHESRYTTYFLGMALEIANADG